MMRSNVIMSACRFRFPLRDGLYYNYYFCLFLNWILIVCNLLFTGMMSKGNRKMKMMIKNQKPKTKTTYKYKVILMSPRKYHSQIFKKKKKITLYILKMDNGLLMQNANLKKDLMSFVLNFYFS